MSEIFLDIALFNLKCLCGLFWSLIFITSLAIRINELKNYDDKRPFSDN